MTDSVGYVVTVHLLPQDATDAEFVVAVSAAREQRQSVVYSADDARRLVQPGAPGSRVIVWDPERWTQGDIIAWLGVPCEVRRFVTPVAPINVYPRYYAFAQWNAMVMAAALETGAELRRMNTSQPAADEAVGWPI